MSFYSSSFFPSPTSTFTGLLLTSICLLSKLSSKVFVSFLPLRRLLLLCNNFVFLNLLFNPLNHHKYNTLILNLLLFLFQYKHLNYLVLHHLL